ncbi:MAG TPA: PDZ domain-containing protein [Vicinamibacterales bacterium]|nr:PDZ domain-containing protein [Vicinamibacterales bacterium]
MIRTRVVSIAAAGALVAGAVTVLQARAIDGRMFRYPDVSATRIAFVYAGDIWTVPRAGGAATRLSSPLGEEMFPRFSPDGSQIAYSANYDGNLDVYVVPVDGGEPKRLTYHPMDDRVIGWHPDGKRVLFASGRESGRQRFNQFYLVNTTGGLPEKLPVPYGEFGAFSRDGRQFVYMPQSQDFRTWKRYRGGWAPDLWLFDLQTLASRNLTSNPANDAQPMWRGNTVYFLSDRDKVERNNIWALDTTNGRTRQITTLTRYDITFPSINGDTIVFQAGGRLNLLDLNTEKVTEVPVTVTTDVQTLRPTSAKAGDLIVSAGVSPTGQRAVFEARGDVVTLPAENGAILNLTRSSGVAERYPTWSPDGTTIAYWSDRSGEYELTVRPADGSGTERKITSLGAGFRYPAQWSPDSKKVVFADQSMKVRLLDIESGNVTLLDQSPQWMAHGALEAWRFAWSPDSRWIAYARAVGDYGVSAIYVVDSRDGKKTQVTSGYLNDSQPTFDPDGKYLFYASDRTFAPVYGSFDTSWTYANPTRLIALPLRKNVPSPLAPKNDVEPKPAASTSTSTPTAAAAPGSAPKGPASVDIDFDGLEQRAVVLPPAAGNYADLTAVSGKLVYRRLPKAGSPPTDPSALMQYDEAERSEQTILEKADGVSLSADGKKALVRVEDKAAIVDVRPAQKLAKPMPTSEIEVPVDPRAEWKQMFLDAYRFERDFFYDPNMHGVDWAEMRDSYLAILADAVTRWDVNFVLGEFIGELDASHTYRGGGVVEEAPEKPVGMLGVDWEVANGAYRIKKIIRGGPWDVDVRSPLDEPGVDVSAGDYVLAVNGVPLRASEDPWAAFQGLAGKTVMLTVSKMPSPDQARSVVVKCLPSEVELRFRQWIEERRQQVDKATDGRVGYIYVQSTGTDAQNELMRQFVAQFQKDGLIIDERFNSGGQIPDRFIELLNRPMLAYWAVRDGASWQWPPVAHAGPKVMLINGWSGSGGDAFPFYFREAGLGPLIGTRTWGGLIGISGAPPLVDGGSVTVPTFRMYDPKGKWFAEGHGVDPDIRVDEDPTELAKGRDTQLLKAIDEAMTRVKANPPAPGHPPYEKRIGGGRGGGF